jgi:hypothetical protein
MALSLQQIRDYVRLHLDLEVEDLPDVVIDTFAREGSRRIERAEPRWPFYEVTYPLTLIANASSVVKNDIATDLDQISSINHTPAVAFPPLVWVGHETINDQLSMRPGALGRPMYFSEWAGSILFYPAADIEYTFNVNGYKQPADWVADGAGGVPDMPDELHNTVALWCMSKAYYQQEDDVLGATFERQFSDELNEFRRRLVITPYAQPLVIGGGTPPDAMQRFARPRFDWEVH